MLNVQGTRDRLFASIQNEWATQAADIYRWMSFDQIEDFVDVAATVDA